MNITESRFFRIDDEKNKEFFFRLHPTWWSRFYEYVWAAKFAEGSDIALDAASGICHPLKFYLLDVCRKVHAVDYDPRILSSSSILEDVREVFGDEGVKKLDERYLKEINYACSTLEKMPYGDMSFDKIYCISVLEHLNDWFNKYRTLSCFPILHTILPRGLYVALREFKRVLKDDGIIVLTFDYPTINLRYFKKVIHELGLHFVGNVDFSMPSNPLYSKEKGLYCFRAVLRK